MSAMMKELVFYLGILMIVGAGLAARVVMALAGKAG